GFQAEHHVGKIERSDLAPAVHENFASAYGPADDPVEVVGAIIFSVNLRVPPQRQRRSHRLDGSGPDQGMKISLQRLRYRSAALAPRRTAPKCRVHQHPALRHSYARPAYKGAGAV